MGPELFLKVAFKGPFHGLALGSTFTIILSPGPLAGPVTTPVCTGGSGSHPLGWGWILCSSQVLPCMALTFSGCNTSSQALLLPASMPHLPGKACWALALRAHADLSVSRRCLGSSVITGDEAFPRGSQWGDRPETGVPGCFGSCKHPCGEGRVGQHVRPERKVTSTLTMLGFEQKACDVMGSFTELMFDIEDWQWWEGGEVGSSVGLESERWAADEIGLGRQQGQGNPRRGRSLERGQFPGQKSLERQWDSTGSHGFASLSAFHLSPTHRCGSSAGWWSLAFRAHGLQKIKTFGT